MGAARAESVLVDGEFKLRASEFARIATLLQSETGIHLTESKASLVYSRLAKRVRALGLKDFESYCSLIAQENGRQERLSMCAALTTNVTRFFREPHHFDHLRTQMMPKLIDEAKRGRRVRIWSAASSSGEEPYSIALTVLGAFPDAGNHDVRILATDINAEKLEHGRRGIYDARAIDDVPVELRRRYFKPVAGSPNQCQIAQEARDLVVYNELNLIGNWPMRGKFQVIFCRNVVIYFDEPTRDRLWARLAACLEPSAVFYIGHSERITGEASASLRNEGITIYRNVGGTTR